MSRSTINQYGYAIKAYHKMLGDKVEFKRLSSYNYLPLYFSADEVERIFDTVRNIKHLAVLKTRFYGCLRVSELCNLNDEDIDLEGLTLDNINELIYYRFRYIFLWKGVAAYQGHRASSCVCP